MADAPFLYYKELISSSAIDFAVFFNSSNDDDDKDDCLASYSSSSQQQYLCTATDSSLSIYKVVKNPPTSSRSDSGNNSKRTNSLTNIQLSLLLNEKVFGKPQSVGKYSFTSTQDILIFTVDTGKVIVVEYCPTKNKLEVLHVVNADEDAFGIGSDIRAMRNGKEQPLGLGCECTVAVDPHSAMSCTVVYGQYLLFVQLPACKKQHQLLKLQTQQMLQVAQQKDVSAAVALAGNNARSHLTSVKFMCDIQASLKLVGPIVDFAFVGGYGKPTLCVLQESAHVPFGHVGQVRNSFAVTLLAVDSSTRSLTIMWQRRGLPHDCVTLLPLEHSDFPGAVGIVSLNCFLIVSEDTVCALATNGFASSSLSPSLQSDMQPWEMEEGVELDASRWVTLHKPPSTFSSFSSSSPSSSSSLSSSSHHEHDAVSGGMPAIVLGSLKDGRLLKIQIVGALTRGNLRHISFIPEILARSTRATAHVCVSSAKDMLFISSRHSEALLLGVQVVATAPTTVAPLTQTNGHRLITPINNRGFTSVFWEDDSHIPEECSESGNIGSSGHTTATTGDFMIEHAKRVKRAAFEEASKLFLTIGRDGDGSDDDLAGDPRVKEAEALYGSSVQQQLMSVTKDHREFIKYGDFFSMACSNSSSISNDNKTTNYAAGRSGYGTFGVARVSLRLLDSVPVLGPVLDGLFTKADDIFHQLLALDWNRSVSNSSRLRSTVTAGCYIAERESKDALQLCAGLDEASSLYRVYNGLSMSKISSRHFAGATAVQSLSINGSNGLYGVLLVVYSARTRAFYFAPSTTATSAGAAAAAAAASRSSGDDVQFREVPTSESLFKNEVTTINSGTIEVGVASEKSNGMKKLAKTTSLNSSADVTIIIQVYPCGVRPIEAGPSFTEKGSALLDISLTDSIELGGMGGTEGEVIVSADIKGYYVSALTNKQNLYILKFNCEDRTLELKYRIKSSRVRPHLYPPPPPSSSSSSSSSSCSSTIDSDNSMSSGAIDTTSSSSSSSTSTSASDDDDEEEEADEAAKTLTALLQSPPTSISLFQGIFRCSSSGNHNRNTTGHRHNIQTTTTSSECELSVPLPDYFLSSSSSTISDEPSTPAKKRPIEEVLLYSELAEQATDSNKAQHHLSGKTEALASLDSDRPDPDKSSTASKKAGKAPTKAALAKLAKLEEAARKEAVAANVLAAANAAEEAALEEELSGRTQEFLCVTEASGSLYIVRLLDLRCVFSSEQESNSEHCITNLPTVLQNSLTSFQYGSSRSSNSNKEEHNGEERFAAKASSDSLGATISSPDAAPRFVTQTQLIRLYRNAADDRDTSASTICLLAIFNTGDMVTYCGVEATTGSASSNEARGAGLSSFYKSDHRQVFNAFTGGAGAGSASISALNGSAPLPPLPPPTTTPTSTAAAASMMGAKLDRDISNRHATSTRLLNASQLRCIAAAQAHCMTTTATSSSTAAEAVFDTANGTSSVNTCGFSGSAFNVANSIDGRNGVLVAGNTPLFLSSHKGLPQFMPLGLPELPHSNYGYFTVCAFSLGDRCNRSSNSSNSRKCSTLCGVVTLWREIDDISAGGASAPKTRKQLSNKFVVPSGVSPAVLTMYQELKDLVTFPHSAVSLRRLHVGKTVHKCVELLKKTDDKTEQALLDRKTFVMNCSEEVSRPFEPATIPKDEEENEELYERYFTDLTSVCQPNEDIGPPPLLGDTVHSLVTVQGAATVDVYTLPPRERVMDMAVVYLSVFKEGSENTLNAQSTQRPFGAAAIAAAAKEKAAKEAAMKENRVFIMASTSIADLRGEDTQGGGRLLLFGLDYGLYEDDTATTAAAAADVKEENAVSSDHDVSDNHSDSGEGPMVSTNPDDDVASNSNTDHTSKVAVAVADAKTTTAASSSTMASSFLGAIHPKLRLLWSGPGPCSVVKQLNSEYIITTVGSTLYVYKMNAKALELDQVSFYFAQFFISSVTVLGNYIIIANMFHGVQLLKWRVEDLSLNAVSKDFDSSNVLTLCTSFIVNGNRVGFLCSDDEGNVQLLQENPRKLESIKGTRLLHLADFHIGSDATMLLPHDLLSIDVPKRPPPIPGDTRPPPPPPRARKAATFPIQIFGTRYSKSLPIHSSTPLKTCNIVGTLSGGLGALLPLDERIYRRLALLQQLLITTVQTPLWLNPSDYRIAKTSRFRSITRKGVVDGAVLALYMQLHPQTQEEMAAAVGVTPYVIFENLREIDAFLSFF